MVNITSSRDPVPNHIEVKYTKANGLSIMAIIQMKMGSLMLKLILKLKVILQNQNIVVRKKMSQLMLY